MKAEMTDIPTVSTRVHSEYKGEFCLKSGSPTVSTSRGEALLKDILDFIFLNEPYLDNVKPPWLKGLELDRYYPNLKIAFEYQGFQHSYFVPNFHRNLTDLKVQKKRDKEKRKTCRQQQVILVTLEYWALSIGQVCQRISSRLKKRRKWKQTSQIQQLVQIAIPKTSGRLKQRKTLNARCLAYKKLIKANYKSGKWVKRQAYQERRRLSQKRAKLK